MVERCDCNHEEIIPPPHSFFSHLNLLEFCFLHFTLIWTSESVSSMVFSSFSHGLKTTCDLGTYLQLTLDLLSWLLKILELFGQGQECLWGNALVVQCICDPWEKQNRSSLSPKKELPSNNGQFRYILCNNRFCFFWPHTIIGALRLEFQSLWLAFCSDVWFFIIFQSTPLVFLFRHLKQNGKSTGDITPQSVWKLGEIMSPPSELSGQIEAAAGVNEGNWITTNHPYIFHVLLSLSLLTADCIWKMHAL